MKFRCERDVLVEALALPGGRPPSRTGTLPVLSGVRIELDGRPPAADRQRPRAHDPGRRSPSTATPTASPCCRPSSPPTSCGRSSRGAVTVEVDGDDAHITAGRSQFTVRLLPADEFPRLRRAAAERGHAAPPSFGRRRCARSSAPPAPTSPGRSSPACCWPPRATACASWPPTRTGWPCATCRAPRCCARARRCWCRRGR